MEFSTTDTTNYDSYTVSGTFDVPTNATTNNSTAELNVPYAVCEIIVALSAVLGNGLVIIVFGKDRKLRRRTNYYIISLATADLLVGLFAIPFAILASIGLPRNLHACLFTVSVLVVLCTISIFCLVAVSVDRYWAILYPMVYARNIRTKTAIGIICVCWIAGTIVGFLPLLGWNAGKKSNDKCIFVEVMDYDYLVFLYFATIIFPALLIAAFYAHIYRVVVKQLQQIVTMNPGRRGENQTTGTMLRLLGAAQKRDVKATQNLSRIVIFFIICWFPLYTINCVQAFCPDCTVSDILLNSCIILSHLNSVGNPILYAYHLKDFRAALKSYIYKILFPNSVMRKTARPSVISDDRGSRRSNIRQNFGINNSRTPRTSLLRRATNNATTTVVSPNFGKINFRNDEKIVNEKIICQTDSNSPTSSLDDKKNYEILVDETRDSKIDAKIVSSKIGSKIGEINSVVDDRTIDDDDREIIDTDCRSIVRSSTVDERNSENIGNYVDAEMDDRSDGLDSIVVIEVDVNADSLDDDVVVNDEISTIDDLTIDEKNR